ncbi:MAG TPA: hypothetical protein VF373_05335, partial [Prolixibacteraceae bacterium]
FTHAIELSGKDNDSGFNANQIFQYLDSHSEKGKSKLFLLIPNDCFPVSMVFRTTNFGQDCT